MFDQMAKDLIYSARGLVRERAFALTTIATLTVALALVTVVFAIFNAYVLRPYAVRDPYSLYKFDGPRETQVADRPDARSAGATTRTCNAGRICSTT